MWKAVENADYLPVVNPATAQVIGEVPLSHASDVDAAAQAAQAAFSGWRATPATQRIQYLFKFKNLL